MQSGIHGVNRFAQVGTLALLTVFACTTATVAAAGDRERKDRGVDVRPPDGEHRALVERAEGLEQALGRLEGVDGPEADKKREMMQDALRQTHARMASVERANRRDGAPPEQGGDVDRRLNHMHLAAENLRAAGMENQARMVMKEAEQLQRRRAEAEEARMRQREGRDDARKMPDEALARHVEELTQVVREMREELHKMRVEMDALKDADGDDDQDDED